MGMPTRYDPSDYADADALIARFYGRLKPIVETAQLGQVVTVGSDQQFQIHQGNGSLIVTLYSADGWVEWVGQRQHATAGANAENVAATTDAEPTIAALIAAVFNIFTTIERQP